MFELCRINRKIDENPRLYEAELEKARKQNKSQDEIDAITREFAERRFRLEVERLSVVTRILIRKASQLLVPTPEYDDESMWERSTLTGDRYLTEKGITNLRNLIREESAMQRKAFLEWTSHLIGLIGAITGLLAVIFSVT